MQPLILPLPFSYKHPNSDLWVFNTASLPIPARKIKDQQMIILGPGSVGGNHKHPRTEWFVAMSSGLVCYWLDVTGKLQKAEMFSEKNELVLIEIPPWLPHAVKNENEKNKAVLVEFADDKAKRNEFVLVIP